MIKKLLWDNFFVSDLLIFFLFFTCSKLPYYFSHQSGRKYHTRTKQKIKPAETRLYIICFFGIEKFKRKPNYTRFLVFSFNCIVLSLFNTLKPCPLYHINYVASAGNYFYQYTQSNKNQRDSMKKRLQSFFAAHITIRFSLSLSPSLSLTRKRNSLTFIGVTFSTRRPSGKVSSLELEEFPALKMRERKHT